MIYLTGVGFRRVDASDWRLYPMEEMKDKKNIIGYVHSTESFGAVDGPGIRFIVFLQGCNMRCKYCHNPETWAVPENEGSIDHLRSCGIRVEIKTPEEILIQALRYKPYWKNGGGITVSGGEALLQIDFVTELFRLAKEAGVNTCLDTSGNPFTREGEFFEKFNRLCEVTDLFMLDIKQIDDEKHRDLTGFTNKNILDMAGYLSDIGKDMWIRHVLVPGITTDEKDLRRLAEFIKTLKTVKKVEVLPYHKMGIPEYERLGIPYRLPDTEPPTKECLDMAKAILGAM